MASVIGATPFMMASASYNTDLMRGLAHNRGDGGSLEALAAVGAGMGGEWFA
jgi:hypothetical protein